MSIRWCRRVSTYTRLQRARQLRAGASTGVKEGGRRHEQELGRPLEAVRVEVVRVRVVPQAPGAERHPDAVEPREGAPVERALDDVVPAVGVGWCRSAPRRARG